MVRSAIAVENVDAAVEIKQDLAERGVSPEDDHTPRLRTEKLGLALERTAIAFGVDIGEIKTSEGGAEWLKYYEPYAAGYRNLQHAVQGTARGVRECETASPFEATRLAVEALEVLGLSPTSPNGAPVDMTVLDPAENPVLAAVFEKINLSALRLYQDRHGARRAKAGPIKARTVVSTVNSALSYFDGELVGVYLTQNDKKQGRPSHYVLRWPWSSRGLDVMADPPAPQPQHPSPI